MNLILLSLQQVYGDSLPLQPFTACLDESYAYELHQLVKFEMVLSY